MHSDNHQLLTGLLRHTRYYGDCQAENYLPFKVAEQTVGAVHRERLANFTAYPEVFQVGERDIRLSPSLSTPEARTRAVDAVLRDWWARGGLPNWRGEPYRVAEEFHAPPVMLLERAAARLFGVRTYGVHLNGLCWRKGRLHLWLGRRSRHSPTYPSRLDQLVAGGLTAGMSVAEVLSKECMEEAAIPPELAARAVPVGLVSYRMERDHCLIRDTLIVYDLMLPETFEPRNTDGEVEEFLVWPVEKVMETVAFTDEFKTNCNLVILDFLLRHGYLHPDQGGYLEIAEQLCDGR